MAPRPTGHRCGGYRLPAGTTRHRRRGRHARHRALHHLVGLADASDWRLVLVGDPRQLQAVGRGGMFDELCATGRVHELAPPPPVHRRRGKPPPPSSCEPATRRALDTYEAHGRIVAGTFDDHLDRLADAWLARHDRGPTRSPSPPRPTTTSTPSTTPSNTPASRRPPRRATASASIAGGERAHVGDVIVTRRNDRSLTPTPASPSATATSGPSPPSHRRVAHRVPPSPDTAPSPSRPTTSREHVRLGYAATEHGNQGDTVDVAIDLVSPATTHRGLYVGATRGRDDNHLLVVTDTHDLAEARDVLDTVLANDRADIPAVAQRRDLARQSRARPIADGTEPASRVPDWVDQWRGQLEQRREDLVGYLDDRARRRAEPPSNSPTSSRHSPPPGPPGSPTTPRSARSKTSCGMGCGPPVEGQQ